jgi:putative membrane protein
VLIGAYFLIRALVLRSLPFGAPRGEDEALRILKERYARGEITKEEYEQRRKDLLESP